VAAIESKGWSVWWDPEINPGQEFDDQIEAEIEAALAVLVVWTPVSVVSRWVRGEAREAAERGILVPVRFDQARLPMDVRAIHTTDLDGWNADPASPVFQEVLRALSAMMARRGGQSAAAAPAPAAPASSRRSRQRRNPSSSGVPGSPVSSLTSSSRSFWSVEAIAPAPGCQCAAEAAPNAARQASSRASWSGTPSESR